MRGIAGEALNVGDMLMRGLDGKYYRASGQTHLAGTPAAPIDKGQLMETDDGKWRPVPTNDADRALYRAYVDECAAKVLRPPMEWVTPLSFDEWIENGRPSGKPPK